jgi:hypothetical protein
LLLPSWSISRLFKEPNHAWTAWAGLYPSGNVSKIKIAKIVVIACPA